MTLLVQLATEHITATVSSDDPVHPDLLDEMVARVIRLFEAGNNSLPEAEEDEGEE